MNKKGQLVDAEVLMIPGFWALLILTLAATLIGYLVSTKMDAHFPLWQVLIFMVFEVIAVYIISMKMFD